MGKGCSNLAELVEQRARADDLEEKLSSERHSLMECQAQKEMAINSVVEEKQHIRLLLLESQAETHAAMLRIDTLEQEIAAGERLRGDWTIPAQPGTPRGVLIRAISARA